jgi:hypothetical protein
MMPRASRWILGLVTAVAASSCGEGAPTEPQAAGPTAALSSSRSDEVVGLLKRTSRLPRNLTASAIIGPRGGHIRIEEAGVRVDFPRGAVSAPTLITVTAVHGRNVAYTFEPHGLVFNKPATLSQSLRNTTAWKNPALAAQLQGSYFERLLVDETETYARSLERRPGNLRDSARQLEFSIEHFSGYMVSVGKSGSGVDVDVEISIR